MVQIPRVMFVRYRAYMTWIGVILVGFNGKGPDSPGEMSPLTEKSSVDDEDAWLDMEKRRKPARPYADDDMVAVKSEPCLQV